MQTPQTKLELRISCRRLIDKDVLSKSDPQVIVYTSSALRGGGWVEYDRTEMIKDNLNPDFTKPIKIDYFFEEEQKLKFVVLDVDKPNGFVSDQDLLGTFETTIANIVTAKGQALQKPLLHPSRSKAGYIKIVAEEETTMRHVVKMTFHGRKLDKKDLFGKSDPFLQISRTTEDGAASVVYRSKHIANTLNPTWEPAVIPLATLCNGDMNRQLIIEVLDWNRTGTSDLIGLFRASAHELSVSVRKEFALVNPDKAARKKKYQNSGYLTIVQFTIEEVPSFLDYLAGGTQLGLDVAIDFTASNGNPSDPNSLHYRNSARLNHYQEAILSVGNILQEYDTDKQFPVYGFGARFPNGTVSHCFNLNGNPNPEVYGVDGILQAYNQALGAVQLYGPTNFSPIINQVAQSLRDRQQEEGTGSHYSVLLIITDGEITDMPATVDAIVRASTLPLSIVIVGVGNADFTKMHVLDGDDEPLVSNGVRCQRDIVQFVPYRDVAGNTHKLAKEVLAEIPDQFVGFMRLKGIKPRPARAASFMSITSQDSFAPSVGGSGSGYALAGPARHSTVPSLRNHEPGQQSSVPLQRVYTTANSGYYPPGQTDPGFHAPPQYEAPPGPPPPQGTSPYDFIKPTPPAKR
ncbi:Copine-domain-containing protein [Phlyctochytrium arcticum]|nr:Copine-domain-containing protein [Phlyctochytrium arcticum]